MGKVSEKIYCAFCRIERNAYTKRSINFKNILLVLLASCLLMVVFWQSFDPKVFILFSVFLFLSEVFIQIRWRLSVTCPYCGFDPVVYVKDKEKASQKVKLQLKRIKEEKDILMPKNPFKYLPFQNKNANDFRVKKMSQKLKV